MPEIDLEPHEYKRRQRETGQPILSPGGGRVLLYVAGMMVLGVVLTLITQPVARELIALARAFVEGR